MNDESTTNQTLTEVYDERRVPTIYSDGLFGIAHVGGLERVLLVEFVFNTRQDAQNPTVQPVANLIMPRDALVSMAREILAMVEDKPDANAT